MKDANTLNEFSLLFASLFGGGLFGDDPTDLHSHACPRRDCGHVWTHLRSKIPDGEDEYTKAHTCPKCNGATCYLKSPPQGEPNNA